MCGPAAPLMMVAGAGVQAAGSLYGGFAGEASAFHNARIANQNAAYADTQAGDTLQRGQREVAFHYMEVGQLAAQQRAAEAANGLDLSFGTPVDVAGGTALMGEIDADTLRRNSAREAEGYRIQSQNYADQARSYVAQGKSAMAGGIFGAAGSLFGMAGQLAAGVKGTGSAGFMSLKSGSVLDTYSSSSLIGGPLSDTTGGLSGLSLGG